MADQPASLDFLIACLLLSSALYGIARACALDPLLPVDPSRSMTGIKGIADIDHQFAKIYIVTFHINTKQNSFGT